MHQPGMQVKHQAGRLQVEMDVLWPHEMAVIVGQFVAVRMFDAAFFSGIFGRSSPGHASYCHEDWLIAMFLSRGDRFYVEKLP